MLPAVARARTTAASRFAWIRCISSYASTEASAVQGRCLEQIRNSSEQRHSLWSLLFSRQYVVSSLNKEDLHWHQQSHWLQQVRYTKVAGADLKVGNVIEKKGRIYQVLSTQHTTQGRGGATIQVELRDVQSGTKVGERFRTSESVERVFVDEKPFTFLYMEDGGDVVLMDPTTFEQVTVPKTMFGDSVVYLLDGMTVTLQLFGPNSTPLTASVPPRVTCKVVETEPYYKGQTAVNSYKHVVLENGVELQAPPFVDVGDSIVVCTADNSYVERAK